MSIIGSSYSRLRFWGPPRVRISADRPPPYRHGKIRQLRMDSASRYITPAWPSCVTHPAPPGSRTPPPPPVLDTSKTPRHVLPLSPGSCAPFDGGLAGLGLARHCRQGRQQHLHRPGRLQRDLRVCVQLVSRTHGRWTGIRQLTLQVAASNGRLRHGRNHRRLIGQQHGHDGIPGGCCRCRGFGAGSVDGPSLVEALADVSSRPRSSQCVQHCRIPARQRRFP